MNKAHIISTGTELMLGTTVDTNSVYLSRKLSDLGIKVVGKSIVGDSAEYIRLAFQTGFQSADLVIASGGLGPTLDDLTKDAACQVLDVPMELVEEEVQRLKDFFSRWGRTMPESNLRQAMFPPGAVILKNPRGTAPGMYLRQGDKTVVLLPGPPREMTHMYENEVEPLLRRDFGSDAGRVANRTIKVLGLGESRVDEILAEVLDDPQGCSLALLARDGEIHIKITAEGKDGADSLRILDEICQQIMERLGDYVFACDEDTLESIVANLLAAQGSMLAVAESCTGGLLAKTLTDIPGSSQYFWGSVTCYSNQAKERILGVSPATLEQYGAVSPQTAAEMARGIMTVSGADYGIAITGIAGPDGGTESKPVGLVYIALQDGQQCQIKEMHFVGGRDGTRILATKTALDLLRRRITGGKAG